MNNPVLTAFNGAWDYDRQARIQAQVAQRLAQGLEAYDPQAPLWGLELGCGTGFFSRLWLERLPHTRLLITDMAPAMVQRAHDNLNCFPACNKSFVVMDAENLCLRTSFDLIAASLVFQWFRQPECSLPSLFKLLRPEGRLLFATLGPDTFREWRDLCARYQIPCGLHPYPDRNDWMQLAARHDMTLTLSEEHLEETHPSPKAFLRRLKAIGAKTPLPGHQPVAPGIFRPMLTTTSATGQPFMVTHHIIFGTMMHPPSAREQKLRQASHPHHPCQEILPP
ncbi:MAG: methyltransferase domain-containing protein [Magnetococcales bacterium]|nr:methyltransferase domain-containing protein [Magnetococcales bacterium]